MRKKSKTSRPNASVFIFTAVVFVLFIFIVMVSQMTPVELSISPRLLAPLAMIFIGLILIETKNWVSAAIGVITSILVVVIIGLALLSYQNGPMTRSLTILPANSNDAVLIEDYSLIGMSVVHLDIENTEMNINGNTDALVECQHTSNDQLLSIEDVVVGGTQNTHISTNDLFRKTDGQASVVDIGLSPNKTTHILGSIQSAFVTMNLAAVELEIAHLSIQDSDVSMMFGNSVEETFVQIDLSNSQLNFNLPESSSVEVVQGENTLLESHGDENMIYIELMGDEVNPVVDWY